MPIPMHRPTVRRRLLIALGAAALAVPFGTLSQQADKIRRIGFLAARSRSTPSNPDVYYDAFMLGMRELGYVEGKNLVIEWRFADGQDARLPSLAAELVKLNVEVLVTHGTRPAEVAHRATTTIPIVFMAVGDPIGSGLAVSLARPGGNITGQSNITVDVSPKLIELLKNMIPTLSHIAILANPGNSSNVTIRKNIQTAAQRLSVAILAVDARTPEDIERGFSLMTREHAQAVIVAPDNLFDRQRSKIAVLALKNRMPSMYPVREYVLAGGLMSYGAIQTDVYRRAATYVDKILKGAKPGELPIEQPTQIHLAINRNTANALGITISPEMLLRANEVIE